MKFKFDVEKNVDKWGKRFKEYKREAPEDIKEPMVEVFCETISEIIKESPSKTGLTRAGWVKPLREEGKEVPDLLGDDEEIPKEKREMYVKQGEENSFYFKSLDAKTRTLTLEVVNANKGVVFQEYGDSQQAPSGIVRKQSMEMQSNMNKKIGDVIKDLGDKK